MALICEEADQTKAKAFMWAIHKAAGTDLNLGKPAYLPRKPGSFVDDDPQPYTEITNTDDLLEGDVYTNLQNRRTVPVHLLTETA